MPKGQKQDSDPRLAFRSQMETLRAQEKAAFDKFALEIGRQYLRGMKGLDNLTLTEFKEDVPRARAQFLKRRSNGEATSAEKSPEGAATATDSDTEEKAREGNA